MSSLLVMTKQICRLGPAGGHAEQWRVSLSGLMPLMVTKRRGRLLLFSLIVSYSKAPRMILESLALNRGRSTGTLLSASSSH